MADKKKMADVLRERERKKEPSAKERRSQEERKVRMMWGEKE